MAIDVLRGRNALVRDRFQAATVAGAPMCLSVIAWHELMFGAQRSAFPDQAEQRLRTWCARLAIESLEPADVEATAQVRARLPRGRGIGAYDLLIAGQALARGWTVVTANVREFSRVEGLNVIDWSKSASPAGVRSEHGRTG